MKTPYPRLGARSWALAVALMTVGAAACDRPDDSDDAIEVGSDAQESVGVAQPWPGEDKAPCGQGVPLTTFDDDVGTRALVETRALITSARAYERYFGHPAPKGVNLGREWVIFYAAGRKPSGGYKAGVHGVAPVGELLRAVTVLETPGRCGATTAITTPYVLVKFPAQRTKSVEFQHSERAGRCGEPDPIDPCARVKCPPDTQCVIAKSNPPQAQCIPVDPKPEPARCTSSEQCGKGQRCSTERGDCQGCGGGRDVVCPAVCFGVCEPIESNVCTGSVLKGDCRSERDLRAEATAICEKQGLKLTDFGLGQACFAGGYVEAKYTCCGSVMPPPPPPPPPPVKCVASSIEGMCESEEALKARAAETCNRQGLSLRDFGVGNACFAGGFAAAKFTCCDLVVDPPPPPPPPPGMCFGGQLDGMCQSEEAIKTRAAEACKREGAALTDFAVGNACFAGGFAVAKYACCTQTSPPQPPAPKCEWLYMGGATSCKPYDTWKSYAHQECAATGRVLNNLSTGTTCDAGNFREIKYECCTAVR